MGVRGKAEVDQNWKGRGRTAGQQKEGKWVGEEREGKEGVKRRGRGRRRGRGMGNRRKKVRESRSLQIYRCGLRICFFTRLLKSLIFTFLRYSRGL